MILVSKSENNRSVCCKFLCDLGKFLELVRCKFGRCGLDFTTDQLFVGDAENVDLGVGSFVLFLLVQDLKDCHRDIGGQAGSV